MKNKSDADRIIESLTIAGELFGQQMSGVALAAMTDELMCYPVDRVITAIGRVRSECTKLTLKSVIERIPGGYPGPEEAWATFPKSEDDTGVVTDAALAAWAVASSLWSSGDVIGARMAFKEAYARTVSEDCGSRLPKWRVSLGFDRDRRADPIREAIECGRLTAEEGQRYAYILENDRRDDVLLPGVGRRELAQVKGGRG